MHAILLVAFAPPTVLSIFSSLLISITAIPHLRIQISDFATQILKLAMFEVPAFLS